MKKLISNIFGFLIICMAFNGMLLFFAYQVYYKDYIKLPNKKYNSFIFADSHGVPLGDIPGNFNVYNFSTESESYFDIKRKITYLLENEYRIDTIYITVEDHTLSPYREYTNNMARSTVYSSIINYENHYDCFKEKWLKYYLPIFQPKVGALLKSFLKSKIKQGFQKNISTSNDWSWEKLPEEERMQFAEIRKKQQFPTDNKSEKLESTLIEIIRLCQLNGITLLGIKFPLSESYLNTMGNINYGADKLFYSNGIKVIDHTLLFKNNNEYFKDPDHLSSLGSVAYTKILLKK
jgi:hypothetical protein